MTTGKTIGLTRWTFVGKIMSLVFYMLSNLVITLLLRNKHLSISWLQSPSAVILEPPKNKICHCFSTCVCQFPSPKFPHSYPQASQIAGSGKNKQTNPACQCRRRKRCGFGPWVRKIPWRRAWQPTPVILPGEFPWTEELNGLQSLGLQRVGYDWSDLARTQAKPQETTRLSCRSMTLLLFCK